MEIFLIILIFFSCALLPNYSVSQTMFKEVGGLLVISSLVIYWLWQKNRWLAAFTAWLVIRMMLPPLQPRGMITLTNVFMAVMLYFAIRYMKLDWRKVFQAIGITCLLQIGMVFAQALNVSFCWNAMNDEGRIWGLFGNSNWSGCYIAMTMPVCLELSKRNKWWLAGLLGLPALILLNSKFALLAGIVGVAFYLYIKYRDFVLKNSIHLLLLFVLSATMLFVLIKPVYLSDMGRFEMWRRTYKLCVFNPGNNVMQKVGQSGYGGFGVDPAYQSHFIQGRGLGEAYNLLPLIQPKEYASQNVNWRQVHNEPLQVLFEYGLIGFVIASGLVISTLRKTTRGNIFLMASLLALIVDSLGFFPFRTSPIGYLAVIYLGAIDNAVLL